MLLMLCVMLLVCLAAGFLYGSRLRLWPVCVPCRVCSVCVHRFYLLHRPKMSGDHPILFAIQAAAARKDKIPSRQRNHPTARDGVFLCRPCGFPVGLGPFAFFGFCAGCGFCAECAFCALYRFWAEIVLCSGYGFCAVRLFPAL